MQDGTADLRDVLAKRYRCLDAVRADAKRKSELEAELSVSRSTVNYAVRELEAHGLVERTAEGFRATQLGRLAAAASDTYDRMLYGQAAAAEALAELPPDSLEEPLLFDGAEVVAPTTSALDRPNRQFLEYVRDAKRVRGFSPIVMESYVDTVRERVLEGSLRVELLLTTGALEALISTYPDTLDGMLAAENITLRESATALPFVFVLLEFADAPDRVGVAIHDDSGVRGFITNDADAAVGWGERLYEEYRADADRVFLRGRAPA